MESNETAKKSRADKLFRTLPLDVQRAIDRISFSDDEAVTRSIAANVIVFYFLLRIPANIRANVIKAYFRELR